MQISVIGSGNIGGTLGRHWAKAEHKIMFSSRHPEQLESMAAAVGAQVGTIAESAVFGEAILLAIPFGKVAEVAQQLGRLDGKIIIDATNPYPQRDGDVASQVIADKSQTATGYVATQFPGAHTIKAFNSIYFKVLEEQAFRSGGDRVAVQVCGDDLQAKQTVKQLIADIGYAPQDLGDLSRGKLFEPNAPLYNQNLKIGEAETLLKQLSVV
jgi:8-hydroxy-5-deazaflavin:NADPH oxidoreductase